VIQENGGCVISVRSHMKLNDVSDYFLFAMCSCLYVFRISQCVTLFVFNMLQSESFCQGLSRKT
jgi:hypothetical protein